jgi:uncharacterized DUF497 family protein
VDITYDPAKNDRNIRERALSFDRVADFDFITALWSIDVRRDYGEARHVAVVISMAAYMRCVLSKSLLAYE